MEEGRLSSSYPAQFLPFFVEACQLDENDCFEDTAIIIICSVEHKSLKFASHTIEPVNVVHFLSHYSSSFCRRFSKRIVPRFVEKCC